MEYDDEGSGEKKGYGGGGGGSKKGKGHGYGQMLKAKLIVLTTLSIGTLISLATKAVTLAMISLVLSVALSRHGGSSKEQSTYEIISSGHHDGGYKRNMDMVGGPQEDALAYQLNYDQYVPPTVQNYY